MIKANLYYKGLSPKGFVIEGHAGMADEGRDIVCAAVSALAQTALLGLQEFLLATPEYRIDDEGYMECWLPSGLTETEEQNALVVIRTMELGLLSMQESYGEFLSVSKRRWTGCD